MTKRILFVVIIFISFLTLTSCEQINYSISDGSVKGDHITAYLEYKMLRKQSKDNVVIDLTYNEDKIYSMYSELFNEFSMQYYDNDWFEAGKYVENMPARYCLYVYNPEIIVREDVVDSIEKNILEINPLQVCYNEKYTLLNNYKMDDFLNPNVNPEISPIIFPEKEHPLFPFVDKKIEYVNTHYEESVVLNEDLFIEKGGKILIETRLCTTLYVLNDFKKTTIVEIYYKIDGNEILFSNEPFDK